ncbi:regenerating islet-derived protein 3-gamma-like isoform X2 [Rousettus aegyptiacus]|uniref:regenerating islet-derived protein 3-gamma-like isoform X2 n=1 Tax=Rousettus aegyptiacus TaxID=9407 RepID=UPI000786C159|nr:regenerating islet-derived protein 3-gamma-like isoform X2 [Rousettus aegyptiacus]
MLPSMALPSLSWMLFSCLVLLSQVQGEDIKKEVASPRGSCPKGSYAFRSYCYALFTTPKSWSDADGYEPNAGGWEWSSDDVLNYLAWERHPSTITNPGYCGSLSQCSGYLSWKDNDCSEKLPYICKFKN